jgi:hypothetical protein
VDVVTIGINSLKARVNSQALLQNWVENQAKKQTSKRVTLLGAICRLHKTPTHNPIRVPHPEKEL